MTVTKTEDSTTVAGYTIVKFAGTGTTTWDPPTGVTDVEYLVVGGGGAGTMGGGGAGGVRSGTGLAVSGTQIVIVGDGDHGLYTAATVGENSSFAGIVASGGGCGGYASAHAPRNGGSGGGGGNGTYGTGNVGGYNPVEGYRGGTGNTQGGGGGGGAGGAGANAPNFYTGGNGGIGTQSSITGQTLYYGGGGGGAGADPPNNGTGGSGGGGNGTYALPRPGYPGTDGLGGGGGGNYNYGEGGAGGSGVVIIKYGTPISSNQSGVSVGSPSMIGC